MNPNKEFYDVVGRISDNLKKLPENDASSFRKEMNQLHMEFTYAQYDTHPALRDSVLSSYVNDIKTLEAKVIARIH